MAAGAVWLMDKPAAAAPRAGAKAAGPSSPAATADDSSLVLRGSQGSASSKVLVTGGYLILEPAFSGLVLALDARFRAALLQLEPAHAAQLRLQPPSGTCSVPIVLFAPQRAAKAAHYELSWSEAADPEGLTAGGWTVRATEEGQEKNKFVEQTIVYCLEFLQSVSPSPAAFRARIGAGWVLYLEGDYQFYSSTPPVRAEGATVPPVVPDGSKTGLGSSAALVSSMVAAMFKHFGALDEPVAAESAAAAAASADASSAASAFLALPVSSRLSLAHNLAQLIHCSAQGKVGSGFDVATAFHGSQTYRRFTPAVISDLLALASTGATADPRATAASIPRSLLLRQLYDSDAAHGWNYSVTPFHLPPGVVVVLADVAGGASTPTMVKLVLEWRKAQPAESEELWRKLHEANQRVASLFGELSAHAAKDLVVYTSCRQGLARVLPAQWEADPVSALPVGQLFCALRAAFLEVRAFLRAMGTAAGVAIEPPAQQALCDDSMQSRGVLLSGVPGAGGDDAIFALLLDKLAAPELEARWERFAFPGEGGVGRRVRRLHVSEAQDTIRVEEVSKDVKPFRLDRA